MTVNEEILTWTNKEKEDALVATYDEAFAKLMIEEGSKPVSKVVNNKEYREAIENLNLNGGFVK